MTYPHLVTVMRNLYVIGWPNDKAEPGALTSIESALFTAYPTEACMQACWVDGPDGPLRVSYRLKKDAPSQLNSRDYFVRFNCLLFDVDDPDTHNKNSPRFNRPALREWFANEQSKLAQLPYPYNSFVYYESKRGYRLVYTLDRPIDIATYVGIAVGVAHALYQHGIDVDKECFDWTHLFRLPFVKGKSPFIETRFHQTIPVETLPRRSPEHAGTRIVPSSYVPGETITSHRNSALTSLAGTLRARGLDSEVIRFCLHGALVTGKCGDWVPEPGEIENIVKSITSYDSGKAVVLDRGSEVEMAKYIMATYQDGALLVYADGFLYRYNYQDGAWHVLDTADVIRFIAGHDGILVKRGVDNEGSVKTKPLALSHGSCQSIYKHVCVQVSEKKFFAKRAIGAAFSNGFVKVSRNEIAIVPHSPEHRVTFAYDFPFNTSAFPERLIRFFISLQKTQQEMTLYRQFIGACILGIATTFQVGLILTGDGANGKSTFLSLVRALFPDDVVTSLTPQSLESEYHRAMLAGALCNICTEAPETRLDETSPLKAAIDGSWVTARVIQTSPFQYQPRAGWLVAANNLPGVTDKSKGWWRRWYVLPWEYEIQEHEKEPHLAEALIEERETIVSWAVASVVDLLNQRGFDEPLSSVTAKQQWKIDNDPVLEFIAACSTQGFTKSSELYAQYRAWSETQRKKALSHRKFGLRLKYHNVPCARDSRGIHYQLEHSL